jgi:hypothetical protein
MNPVLLGRGGAVSEGPLPRVDCALRLVPERDDALVHIDDLGRSSLPE